MLLAPHDRQTINVKQGVVNLGLHRGEDGRLKAPEIDQEKVAAEYVAHLEQHPNDSHAREKLAVLYGTHYHRLDLAVDQLEQLITQPNHVAKQVAHWLNLMADLQVQEGADEDAVRATLQRIIDLFPGRRRGRNCAPPSRSPQAGDETPDQTPRHPTRHLRAEHRPQTRRRPKYHTRMTGCQCSFAGPSPDGGSVTRSMWPVQNSLKNLATRSRGGRARNQRRIPIIFRPGHDSVMCPGQKACNWGALRVWWG